MSVRSVGEEGRRAGNVREILTRSRRGLAALAVILLVLASLIARPRPLLLWNVSASAPEGLYFVGGKGALVRGDMAVARMPQGLRLFAARRGYLPQNVPLVKRVAAVADDVVCASGASIRVNGKLVATRLRVDARERDMPWWSGCVHLVDGDYFFVMSDSPASFDGRYFGVSNVDDVIGEAVLLWRR
jgi:conjugative transfer signal peptidase TraF